MPGFPSPADERNPGRLPKAAWRFFLVGCPFNHHTCQSRTPKQRSFGLASASKSRISTPSISEATFFDVFETSAPRE